MREAPDGMRMVDVATDREAPTHGVRVEFRSRQQILRDALGGIRIEVERSGVVQPQQRIVRGDRCGVGIPIVRFEARWPRSSSACMRKALGRHCSPRRSTRWSSPACLPATNSPASYSHGNCSTVNRLKASLTSTGRAPRSSAQSMPPSAVVQPQQRIVRGDRCGVGIPIVRFEGVAESTVGILEWKQRLDHIRIRHTAGDEPITALFRIVRWIIPATPCILWAWNPQHRSRNRCARQPRVSSNSTPVHLNSRNTRRT